MCRQGINSLSYITVFVFRVVILDIISHYLTVGVSLVVILSRIKKMCMKLYLYSHLNQRI